MAPEMLKRNYHEKCDLWSAGILLYFMVVGSLPFQAPNEQLLHQIILKGKYKIPGTVSEDCSSLLRSLLQVVPEERLSASKALDHPWFAVCLSPSPEITLSFNNLTRYLKLDKIQKLIASLSLPFSL